jgi:hypothetical protein
MSKRRTRSSNKENDTDVSVTDSHTKKRSRGKSTGANKPLDEQTIVNTLGNVKFLLVSGESFVFS